MMASRYDDLNYVLNLAIVQDPPPGSYGTPEPRPQQVGLTWHVYYNNISMNCFLFVWSCCSIYCTYFNWFQAPLSYGAEWRDPGDQRRDLLGPPLSLITRSAEFSLAEHLPVQLANTPHQANLFNDMWESLFKKPEGIQILYLTKMNWIKAVHVYSLELSEL